MELLKYLVTKYPHQINASSADVWTPLHIACPLVNAEAVEILISAGGDQTATDNLGRNVIYLLLAGPRDSRVATGSEIRAILKLLDIPSMHKMLVQRCNEYPGGLTPLARWLYKANGISFARPNRAVIETLLEFATGDDIEVPDATGLLPLHIVCTSHMPLSIHPLKVLMGLGRKVLHGLPRSPPHHS
jgi:ankyrin repeat protein